MQNAQPWYGKWTMGRMISFNTSSPYADARRGQVRGSGVSAFR
ncbi:ClbS/DfsB family four-helix bundle protein [Corynebacterium atrinae]